MLQALSSTPAQQHSSSSSPSSHRNKSCRQLRLRRKMKSGCLFEEITTSNEKSVLRPVDEVKSSGIVASSIVQMNENNGRVRGKKVMKRRRNDDIGKCIRLCARDMSARTEGTCSSLTVSNSSVQIQEKRYSRRRELASFYDLRRRSDRQVASSDNKCPKSDKSLLNRTKNLSRRKTPVKTDGTAKETFPKYEFIKDRDEIRLKLKLHASLPEHVISIGDAVYVSINDAVVDWEDYDEQMASYEREIAVLHKLKPDVARIESFGPGETCVVRWFLRKDEACDYLSNTPRSQVLNLFDFKKFATSLSSNELILSPFCDSNNIDVLLGKVCISYFPPLPNILICNCGAISRKSKTRKPENVEIFECCSLYCRYSIIQRKHKQAKSKVRKNIELIITSINLSQIKLPCHLGNFMSGHISSLPERSAKGFTYCKRREVIGTSVANASYTKTPTNESFFIKRKYYGSIAKEKRYENVFIKRKYCESIAQEKRYRNENINSVKIICQSTSAIQTRDNRSHDARCIHQQDSEGISLSNCIFQKVSPSPQAKKMNRMSSVDFLRQPTSDENIKEKKVDTNPKFHPSILEFIPNENLMVCDKDDDAYRTDKDFKKSKVLRLLQDDKFIEQEFVNNDNKEPLNDRSVKTNLTDKELIIDFEIAEKERELSRVMKELEELRNKKCRLRDDFDNSNSDIISTYLNSGSSHYSSCRLLSGTYSPSLMKPTLFNRIAAVQNKKKSRVRVRKERIKRISYVRKILLQRFLLYGQNLDAVDGKPNNMGKPSSTFTNSYSSHNIHNKRCTSLKKKTNCEPVFSYHVCGSCVGCSAADCGDCENCLDKNRYGGVGCLINRRCSRRKCYGLKKDFVSLRPGNRTECSPVPFGDGWSDIESLNDENAFEFSDGEEDQEERNIRKKERNNEVPLGTTTIVSKTNKQISRSGLDVVRMMRFRNLNRLATSSHDNSSDSSDENDI